MVLIAGRPLNHYILLYLITHSVITVFTESDATAEPTPLL